VNKRLLGFAFALASIAATADAARAPIAEPLLEKRTMALAEELRCLVCQNQTLADSHADLAVDLKKQIREQLTQGKSDQEVMNYMVQRYGDFVLYRPPVKRATWLLWFGPLALLLGGLVFLGLKLNRLSAPLGLTESEKQRAAELLYAPADTEKTK